MIHTRGMLGATSLTTILEAFSSHTSPIKAFVRVCFLLTWFKMRGNHIEITGLPRNEAGWIDYALKGTLVRIGLDFAFAFGSGDIANVKG